eukprot:m.197425 g.197425  ORF g.197425 m.197425 type:complete len:621 (+) comp10645_c0_seq1:1304-3166(+)
MAAAKQALLVILLAATCAAWPSVAPFWPHYPGRSLQVLDGQWSFGYLGAAVPDATAVPYMASGTPNVTTVPGSFDVVSPGISGPRGTALYRTFFTADPKKMQLVQFAACAFYCKVFVDGEFVGDHRAGGYQPFWLSLPRSDKTLRELFVVVDNRFNETTAPTHTGGDFYFYGGITRQVIVYDVAPQHLQRVETFTTDLPRTIIDIRVVFPSGVSGTALLTVSLDNAGPSSPEAYQISNGEVWIRKFELPNGRLWSIEDPYLHFLTVQLVDTAGAVLDAIQVRFGVRMLGIENGRLTINSEQVKLLGYNRHTMWPSTGAALTMEQIQTDIELIKEVGANYIRGAHYPQDQRFLDLCDENGIVVWEETLGPDVKLPNLQNPYFMKYQIQAVNEMIDASINHPSVIFHAFYNEGPSDDKRACPGYNASASAIRARVGDPPTRFVTWASNKRTKDQCFEFADVLSFNSYPAWYDKPGDLDYIKTFWKSQVDWVAQTWPSKPFTISETGAGGVFEWTNKTDPQWSQLYQSEVVQRDVEFAIGESRLSGLTLWQLTDIKVDACSPCTYEPHPENLDVPWTCSFIDVTCHRPGGENHKGSVDFWRRKKQVFFTVQQLYKGNATQAQP